MRILDPAQTAAALPYPALIDGLRRAFAAGLEAPMRHHHTMARSGEPDAVLLLMPAFAGDGSYGGVKIVTVTPGNAARSLPAVAASYLLFDETTGAHLALIDGGELTCRRTAAASALAADHLARKDARSLLVVGAGRVAAQLPAAYRAVRPIERVAVWNPRPARAEALAAQLCAEGFDAEAAGDLEAAVAEADVVSCATLSQAPLIEGTWMRPGQHLDLIGSFTPAMREADDAAMVRGRVFVDTLAALAETGDLIAPMASGALAPDRIAGTLYDLCAGRAGREGAQEITVFKSVGVAVEDLAAAVVAFTAA